VVLAAVGLAPLEPVAAWLLFLAYGASLAVTEGAERALIGDFAPPGQKATAFGVYHLVSSGMLLPGAVVFGGLWEWLGMRAAFFAAALLTLGAMTALLAMVRRRGAGR
jgi:MFS-type transporter involved in bile tolerance (Atg22 family)